MTKDSTDIYDSILTQKKPKEKEEIKKPRMWKVVLLNDDYTTIEFVVEMLKKHFRHSDESAVAITLEVHKTGRGVAGIYSFEIAETKSYEVMNDAKEKGHPLKVALEPE